jgi:hypothetical protein
VGLLDERLPFLSLSSLLSKPKGPKLKKIAFIPLRGAKKKVLYICYFVGLRYILPSEAGA